jgi:arylsulfatase A-like enzyme
VVVCFSTCFTEFRYLALHNTHGPVEAPEEFESLYTFPFALQNTFDAMVSVVDSTVANVTSALKSTGMWNTTLVIWTTDNGSPCEVCNRIIQVFFFIFSSEVKQKVNCCQPSESGLMFTTCSL